MEIVLSSNCSMLTGMFNKNLGYSIQRQKGGFFSKRNSKGHVPPEGHLRFIFDCAAMAQNRMIVADIKLQGQELIDAYKEAGYEPSSIVPDVSYNAHDVFSIKKQEGFEV